MRLQAVQHTEEACRCQRPDRRRLLQLLASAPVALGGTTVSGAAADETPLTQYVDDVDEFRLDLPAGAPGNHMIRVCCWSAAAAPDRTSASGIAISQTG